MRWGRNQQLDERPGGELAPAIPTTVSRDAVASAHAVPAEFRRRERPVLIQFKQERSLLSRGISKQNLAAEFAGGRGLGAAHGTASLPEESLVELVCQQPVHALGQALLARSLFVFPRVAFTRAERA